MSAIRNSSSTNMSFESKIRWISASVKPVQLAQLKSRFKNVINSKRKYSQVNDFYDLVGILIIRGIVSPEDVTVINETCQEYFRIDFSLIPDSPNKAQPIYGRENVQTLAAPSSIPSAAIDIIVNGNICAKQWRPFARALKVDTESVPQENSTGCKIRKVLTKFSKDTDQHRQWPLLEVALEKIRRIDLRDQCRELFNSHS